MPSAPSLRCVASKRSLGALAVVALFAVGCKPNAESRRAPVDASAGPMSRTLRIALIAKSSADPSYLSARIGAESRAKQLAERLSIRIEIGWLTPPSEDGRAQAKRIGQAVDEGFDAVLLCCADPASAAAAIDAAVARGVPVMTFGSDAPDSKRFAYYGVDDLKVGRALVRELGVRLGEHGKIAILAGAAKAGRDQKVESMKAELGRHPGLELVGVFHNAQTPQDAAAEVVRVSNLHTDLRGWAMTGGWALFSGTLHTALSQGVQIVSVGGLPAELSYVDEGLAPLLLAESPFDWGQVGVETIVDKLVRHKDVPRVIEMPIVRVTKDNLGDWARTLKASGFTDVPQTYLERR